MQDIGSFIASGILEMYVLGMASLEETKQVEEMAAAHKEVRQEIESIYASLKLYAEFDIKVPNIDVKALILAMVDYEERLKSGEQPTFPPILNDNSTIADYSQWIKRKDMVMPDNFDQLYVKIIGYTPEAISAIVWIQSETPYEVHTNEYERFLIVEGTCDVNIDGKIHSLVPGNYLQIPLHAGHIVKVTSKTPCKVILQRVAA